MTATIAPGEARARETRDVPPFERIDLRDRTSWVDLIAEPGERENLVVEGPPDVLARINARVEDGVLRISVASSLKDLLRGAVTTSLTRRHVVYRVRARRLLEVRVAGLVRVSVHAFGGDAPVVTRLEPYPPIAPHPPIPPL